MWGGIASYKSKKKIISIIPLFNFWVITKKPKNKLFDNFSAHFHRSERVGLELLNEYSIANSVDILNLFYLLSCKRL